MIINYWDCEYHDYDEIWDGEEELRIYGCTHPCNKDRYCYLDNKWGNDTEQCGLLDLDVKSD